MKRQILFWILILFSFFVKGQDLIDTIYTLTDDTIICNITLVNNYNVFYTYKVKKKRYEDTFIPRFQVASYILNSKGVIVEKQETDSHLPIQKITFAEENGIIYADNVEKPPKYPGGIYDLYDHLQDYVKVYPADVKVFGEKPAVVLYELMIMNDGKIKYARISESCIQNCGLDPKAANLENEILNQISSASDWEPAIIDGNKVNMNIYLPLKFVID